jgi:NADPH:quinone reductase-like Zn-dependent oxidoreductase
MKAIQIEVFGNPAEVVKAVDVPDVGAPAAGEVVIAVETSPINPLRTEGHGIKTCSSL